MKVYNHVVTYTSTHQRKNDTCHVCANFLQGLFRCASWACLLTPWFAVHLCVSWWVSSDVGLAGLAISPKHPLSHPFPASVRFACKFIWPDAADTIHGWYILVYFAYIELMIMINAGKNVHGLSGAAWQLTTVLQVFASSGPDPPAEEKAPLQPLASNGCTKL